MDTDNSCPSGSSSSQSWNSEVVTPTFPSNSFNMLLQNQHSIMKGFPALCSPYEEERLVQAALLNDEDRVRKMLDDGVNPSCRDYLGRTPLHMAACKGFAHIVRILLQRGANPNARDPIGNTALHLAACTNNIDVVLLLLKAGTDACSSDMLGRNPLQLAQSKLKILQRSKFPDEDIKIQASLVIDMLLHFSKYSKKSSDVEALDLELLSSFQNRFILSNTRQDIDAQLSNLLDNLGSLSLKPS